MPMNLAVKPRHTMQKQRASKPATYQLLKVLDRGFEMVYETTDATDAKNSLALARTQTPTADFKLYRVRH